MVFLMSLMTVTNIYMPGEPLQRKARVVVLEATRNHSLGCFVLGKLFHSSIQQPFFAMVFQVYRKIIPRAHCEF